MGVLSRKTDFEQGYTVLKKKRFLNFWEVSCAKQKGKMASQAH